MTDRFIDDRQFRLMLRVGRGLHGNGSSLTPDDRRDLANLMSLLISEIGEQHLKEES